jgi:hypothetical protein
MAEGSGARHHVEPGDLLPLDRAAHCTPEGDAAADLADELDAGDRERIADRPRRLTTGKHHSAGADASERPAGDRRETLSDAPPEPIERATTSRCTSRSRLPTPEKRCVWAPGALGLRRLVFDALCRTPGVAELDAARLPDVLARAHARSAAERDAIDAIGAG